MDKEEEINKAAKDYGQEVLERLKNSPPLRVLSPAELEEAVKVRLEYPENKFEKRVCRFPAIYLRPVEHEDKLVAVCVLDPYGRRLTMYMEKETIDKLFAPVKD